MLYRLPRTEDFILPHGDYRGQKIAAVAVSDEGLLYLEWLAQQEHVEALTKLALETFLGDWSVRAELQKLKDRGTARIWRAEAGKGQVGEG